MFHQFSNNKIYLKSRFIWEAKN